MIKSVEKIYGNRIRVRVCGICAQGDHLLLVNHKGLTDGDFWAPPGGGLELGRGARDTLQTEFREETGLNVTIGDFLFACEFIRSPLHAVELFFEVAAVGGKLTVGKDPEMGSEGQVIQDVGFLSPTQVRNIPLTQKHGLFAFADDVEKIRQLKGYLKI